MTDEGVTDVFRDEDPDSHERIECWTDGTWVKLGRDVENDRCLEFRIEEFNEVEAQLRYFDSGAEKFKLYTSYGGTESYVVYEQLRRPTVIKGHEVVLKLGDDGYPLYTAKQMALDERSDIDAEDEARGYAESIRPHMDIRRCSERGTTGRVDVTFYRGGARVDLRLIDELREDECVEADSVQVARDGEGIQYTFTVVTDSIPK